MHRIERRLLLAASPGLAAPRIARAQSKGAWDFEDVLQTVPGDQAFRPLAEAGCPV